MFFRDYFRTMDVIINWLRDADSWIQIISLISGIIYMVMQVFQHKWMWYLDLVTCITALAVAAINFQDGMWAPLWAQVGLNAWFIAMAAWGIFHWKELDESSNGELHVVKLSVWRLLLTVILLAVCTPLVCYLYSVTNDPSPVLEGISFTFSIFAAWYLSCSHLENWYLWIAADIAVTLLFAQQGDWWMAALYACYIVSAVIGLAFWKRKGVCVQG